jgi:hypothetical protein
MDKIHLKREAGVHLALCGIHPDKERFTTVDLATRYTPGEICKVCLRILETEKEWSSRESDT